MAMSLSRLTSSVRSAILARSAARTMATHLGCRRKGMEIEVSKDPHTHLLLSRYGKPRSPKYELVKRCLKQSRIQELYNTWEEELPMVCQGDEKESVKRLLTFEKTLKLLVERNPKLSHTSMAMKSDSSESDSSANELPPWGSSANDLQPSGMRCYVMPEFDEDGNVVYDDEGYPVALKVIDGTIVS